MSINMKVYCMIVIALLLGGFFGVPNVWGATLSLDPPQGTYVVGDTVSLSVLVDTAGETINAVWGEVTYDSSRMRAVSVSREESIIDLWLEEPSVHASQAVVSFEGLILNPGFSGIGRVATIYFDVLKQGQLPVSFASGAVLLNDGFGTNIVDEFRGAHLSLLASTPRDERTPLPEPEPFSVSQSDGLAPPVVISYTSNPQRLEEFTVRGVSYPQAQVIVFIRTKDGAIMQDSTQSDAGGNFVYRPSDNIAAASFEGTGGVAVLNDTSQQPIQFWLAAMQDTLESEPTQHFDAVVGTSRAGVSLTLILGVVVVVLLLVLVILAINHTRASQRRKLTLKTKPIPTGPADEVVLTELKKDVDDLAYDVEKYAARNKQNRSQNTPDS